MNFGSIPVYLGLMVGSLSWASDKNFIQIVNDHIVEIKMAHSARPYCADRGDLVDRLERLQDAAGYCHSYNSKDECAQAMTKALRGDGMNAQSRAGHIGDLPSLNAKRTIATQLAEQFPEKADIYKHYLTVAQYDGDFGHPSYGLAANSAGYTLTDQQISQEVRACYEQRFRFDNVMVQIKYTLSRISSEERKPVKKDDDIQVDSVIR